MKSGSPVVIVHHPPKVSLLYIVFTIRGTYIVLGGAIAKIKTAYLNKYLDNHTYDLDQTWTKQHVLSYGLYCKQKPPDFFFPKGRKNLVATTTNFVCKQLRTQAHDTIQISAPISSSVPMIILTNFRSWRTSRTAGSKQRATCQNRKLRKRGASHAKPFFPSN